MSPTALFGRMRETRDGDAVVVRLARSHAELPRDKQAFLIRDGDECTPLEFGVYVSTSRITDHLPTDSGIVYQLPEELSYLQEGDVIRVSPRTGDVWVMYRRGSSSNSLLLTERCNSRCIMCSQPPREEHNTALADACLEAIPLMDQETKELGLTGGEPTLLGDKFFEIVTQCRNHLPRTSLHVLSNGRLFNYLSYAQRLAEIDHPDCVIGIPLYSDLAWEHDYCVQAEDAFDQTVRGLLNLARYDVRIELRVVIHAQTVDRLPRLAEFISRNFPFAEHVALMGLEPIGFGKTNLASLWIDPVDYQSPLEEAVVGLADSGMNVSIYNHQLCVLPTALWPFARQSISDWKNIYLPVCSDCSVLGKCGGFFHSSMRQYSRGIRSVDAMDATVHCDI